MLDNRFANALDEARRGDEYAFALIYRDVQPALLRYLTVHSSSAAEDTAADTWLEVARGLGRFDGDERGFRAWVFTIARHKVIDRVRYEARRPSAPLIEATEGDLPRVRDASEELEEAEATRAALALVRTLPPDQAEVILLRVLAGMDNATIAVMLGKSPGAVRVLAHRGLRRLAATLSEQLMDRGVTR
jgi:RNA polymerase sigma-70 factor (ECF subfamily)